MTREVVEKILARRRHTVRPEDCFQNEDLRHLMADGALAVWVNREDASQALEGDGLCDSELCVGEDVFQLAIPHELKKDGGKKEQALVAALERCFTDVEPKIMVGNHEVVSEEGTNVVRFSVEDMTDDTEKQIAQRILDICNAAERLIEQKKESGMGGKSA